MHKTILITGANGGLGSAIARELLEKKYRIIAGFHIRKERLEKLQTRYPKQLQLLAINLENGAGIKKLSRDLIHLDGIVHVGFPAITHKSITQESSDSFARFFTVSVGSLVEIAKIALPHMQKKRWGRIIGISSALALGVPPNKLSNYVTSKSALTGFCKALAVELASYQISVNTISPGVSDTSFLDSFPQVLRDLVIQKIPLKRLAKPDEIAALVAFLLSDSASYITGINIPVAGGMVM